MTPPKTIVITNASTKHGCWAEDTWKLDGECNGRPQWRRQGNPADYLKWDGSRWTINGMQPLDYFVHDANEKLPPCSGWRATNHAAGGSPRLQFRNDDDDRSW